MHVQATGLSLHERQEITSRRARGKVPKEPNRDRATAEAGTQSTGDGTQAAREPAAEGATQAAAESATTSTATQASASASATAKSQQLSN